MALPIPTPVWQQTTAVLLPISKERATERILVTHVFKSIKFSKLKILTNTKNEKAIIIGLFVATMTSCTNPKQAANESSESIEFIYEPTYQSFLKWAVMKGAPHSGNAPAYYRSGLRQSGKLPY